MVFFRVIKKTIKTFLHKRLQKIKNRKLKVLKYLHKKWPGAAMAKNLGPLFYGRRNFSTKFFLSRRVPTHTPLKILCSRMNSEFRREGNKARSKKKCQNWDEKYQTLEETFAQCYRMVNLRH